MLYGNLPYNIKHYHMHHMVSFCVLWIATKALTQTLTTISKKQEDLSKEKQKLIDMTVKGVKVKNNKKEGKSKLNIENEPFLVGKNNKITQK